ncbi:N-6 DNA methylase [Pectinatus brassicae]|uniref:site-specific DNA-methyltransferase (adenine-specific) n=1 Tax=Pectinatus brassicae TaxID=862415 RepID=A0A840UTG9_9FIRM|nr:N-6 DNA methylase [Pectinatus brassicae]MBB5336114.1 type I restriction enzyme M protein [Pectinatus brassicae]
MSTNQMIEKAREAYLEIFNVLRSTMDIDEETIFSFYEYLNKDRYSLKDRKFIKDLKDNAEIDKIIYKYGKDVFESGIWDALSNNSSKKNSTFLTSDALVKLSLAILNIQKSDKVIDLCSGIGNFFRLGSMIESKAFYQGIEINTQVVEWSKMICEKLKAKVSIEQGDVLRCVLENKFSKNFDKAFSNHPIGIRIRESLDILQTLLPDAQGLGNMRGMSSEWLYVAALLKTIKNTGKAVAVMPDGPLFSPKDINIRKWFFEQGYLETVISLPAKMLINTVMPVNLVVLSHDNAKVRIIDASDICNKGRRYNTLSDKNIDEIILLLNTNTEQSKEIDSKDFEDNEYELNPSRYFVKEFKFENGVIFGDIIKNITRGAQIKAIDLDKITVDEETPYHYLQLSDISDGVINEKLPYITEIEAKQDKYCVKSGNLIMSKIGQPKYKFAIADVPRNKKILANGNLFIIDINTEVADPYYIKAFFESNIGTALLQTITASSTIPTISIDKLKKVVIPLPDMYKQQKIAKKYKAILDDVLAYKKKKIEAIDKLKNIFE